VVTGAGHPKLSKCGNKELRTMAATMDLPAQGKTAEAGDVLMQ